jgi:hypothetical protein
MNVPDVAHPVLASVAAATLLAMFFAARASGGCGVACVGAPCARREFERA